MDSRPTPPTRLIEWTGERCVPWAPDVQVVYEHYHRYLWAQALVSDRRVLDLGSGEGFGSAILAETAASVVGVDVDPLTVEHARLNYELSGLEFREASAADLSEFEDNSFDAVVAFELIEHVSDQEAVLCEIARTLSPDGLLLLSTPDRRTYRGSGGENPFHERELTLDELEGLLDSHFRNVESLSQRAAAGSTIDALGESNGPHRRIRLERTRDRWRAAGSPDPMYIVAAASNSALPQLPGESTLSDFDLEHIRAAQLPEPGAATGADAKRTLTARQRFATKRVEGMRSLTLAREELVVAHEEVKQLYAEIGGLRGQLARTQGSVAWRLFERARDRAYSALGGYNSAGGRLLSGTMRVIGKLAFGSASPAEPGGPTGEPIRFPVVGDPAVSIVIPVHGPAGQVHRCLRAVAETADVGYEVILVDDCANAGTKSVLKAATGATVLVNGKNLGYTRSVNLGAARARGRYIVLLNDDTEPQALWLSALVARAEEAPDIGIVAAKLLYPGGVLQEAGGMVWSDGSAENFGRGQEASAPEFNYVREIDYGSAAALLVRSEVWAATGGFDERFAPAYWEDTDLCFQARAEGWRVMYEPTAAIVHAEGTSMGTDTAKGGKRHQRLNASKFASKWDSALADQPRRAASQGPYPAADRRSGPVVLVIDEKVPTPNRDSGSTRMRAIVEALVELECRVLFLPDNGAPLQPYTAQLQSLGVEVLVGPYDLSTRLTQLGSRLQLAILSRPYVASRYLHVLRRFSPAAQIAYDTVDLHFVREQRRQVQAGSTDMSVPEAFKELELANVRAADATFVVTEPERERLLEECPDAVVEVMPNAHDVWDAVPGPSGRAGLLFVGGFEHHPNVDAAVYLCQEIMPLVHGELNGVRLSLVGPNAPPEVTALASDRVDVTGWVEDLRPLLETVAVSVAPLRYGGGMNGKITQSLAAGLPVVTTSIGSEGLEAEDGKHIFVADDPALFAERIVKLHLDNDLWRSLSEGGRHIARAKTSRELHLDILRRMLEHS